MINKSYKPNIILEILGYAALIGGVITANPIFVVLLIFIFIANQML